MAQVRLVWTSAISRVGLGKVRGKVSQRFPSRPTSHHPAMHLRPERSFAPASHTRSRQPPPTPPPRPGSVPSPVFRPAPSPGQTLAGFPAGTLRTLSVAARTHRPCVHGRGRHRGGRGILHAPVAPRHGHAPWARPVLFRPPERPELVGATIIGDRGRPSCTEWAPGPARPDGLRRPVPVPPTSPDPSRASRQRQSRQPPSRFRSRLRPVWVPAPRTVPSRPR